MKPFFVVVIFTIFSCTPEKKEPETREQKIKNQFSQWDGSHLALTNLIKEKMNDPSSYEHVKTEYTIREYYIMVKTTFRGNNKFGAKVLDKVYAAVTTNGDVMETDKEDIWLKRDLLIEAQERAKENKK